MNLTKKQVIWIVGLALVIISCIIFIPAYMAHHHEDTAAEELSELYNDQFVVTKSTVGALSDDFDITVQSENTKIVYDFVSKDGEYSGEYFAENVNAKVNELLQPIVGEDALVMSNVFQDGLQQDISLQDAKVEKAVIHLIIPQQLTDETAQKIAEVLKQQFGEISVAIEAYVVDEEGIFEGITTEVSNFFQLSKINSDSFKDFKFHTQNFDF
jgi:hypothetical protein